MRNQQFFAVFIFKMNAVVIIFTSECLECLICNGKHILNNLELTSCICMFLTWACCILSNPLLLLLRSKIHPWKYDLPLSQQNIRFFICKPIYGFWHKGVCLCLVLLQHYRAVQWLSDWSEAVHTSGMRSCKRRQTQRYLKKKEINKKQKKEFCDLLLKKFHVD